MPRTSFDIIHGGGPNHQDSLESSLAYSAGNWLRKLKDNSITGFPFRAQTRAGEISPWLGALTASLAGGAAGMGVEGALNWYNGEDEPWSNIGWKIPAATALASGLFGYIQGDSNQDKTGRPNLAGGLIGQGAKSSSTRVFTKQANLAGVAGIGLLLNAIMADPTMSHQARQVVATVLGQAPTYVQENLARTVGSAGGAGIAFLVAKYLLGQGIGGSLLMAVLGSSIGGNLMDSTPRSINGAPMRTSTYF